MSTTFEEITRPDNGPLVELNNNMQEVFSQYRKMREYASYLEYELKQKDEHILKVENENSFLRDKHTTFDSNGKSVEPIITQQALSVVPEYVGNYIEECKENRYALNIALDLMVKEYASRKTELSTWVMNNQEQFAKAWFVKYEMKNPSCSI